MSYMELMEKVMKDLRKKQMAEMFRHLSTKTQSLKS